MTQKPKAKATAKKSSQSKLTDAEQVALYMDKLEHPLKTGIETLRKIIKNSNKKLSERIKWNAPSYCYLQDIVTFGPLKPDRTLLLVFHHPFIVKIKSELLEGDYKDRRLVYIHDIKTIKSIKEELTRIINEVVTAIENDSK